MSYRAPPAVLPSLRDVEADLFASALADGIDPRMLLCEITLQQYPATCAAWVNARRQVHALGRAAAAPCPAFTIGPPIGRVRPPATLLPGPGRAVSE